MRGRNSIVASLRRLRTRLGLLGVVLAAAAGALVIPHVSATAAPAVGFGTGMAQPHHVNALTASRTAAAPTAAQHKPFLTRDPKTMAAAKASGQTVRPSRTIAAPKAGSIKGGTSAGSFAGPFIGLSNAVQESFEGDIEPPDTQLAIGPNFAIELVNASVLILDRAGNQAFPPRSIENFPFAFADTAPGTFATDPRVYFDAASGRFFATVLGYTLTPSGNPASGTVLLAVSGNSNPAGSWTVYNGFYNKTNALCDQPVLGISGDKVSVACNEFNSSGSFTDDFFFVFNKSQLLAGGGVGVSFAFSASWFSLTPALAPIHDGAQPDAAVAVYNRNLFGIAQIGVVAITGTPGTTAALAPEVDLAINATNPPPSAAQLNDASGAQKIDTGDNRFLNAVWQGGRLWTGGNDRCTGPLSCLKLVQLDTSAWDPGVSGAPTVAQDLDIAAGDFHLYYPSVTMNAGGDLYTVFSESSATFPVSVGGFHVPACGANSGQPQPFFFIQGSGSYVSNEPTTPPTRWGDYSGAAIDPTDTNKLWLTGEYTEGQSILRQWGTATVQVPVSTAVDSGRPYTGGSDAVGVGAGSTDWFFAEGYTGANFDEFLTIQNPGATQTLCVDYLLQGGGVVSRSYDLPAASRTTLRVNDEVGPGQNVSMHLHAANPIVAERPMYFLFNGSITGGHDVMGATSLGSTFYFAEGTTLSGFSEFLTLMNVDATNTSSVDVTYFFSNGTSKVVNHPVGPHSRVTVVVNDPAEAGPFQNVSMLVHVASGPQILAERPMYFNYGSGGWTGGSVVIGARATSQHLDLAEGFVSGTFDEWLTILNPGGTAANLTITYNVPSGPPVVKTMMVPANSRATRLVNNDLPGGTSNSVHIDSDQPIVVERPMYFDYSGNVANVTGGHDAVAVDSSTLGTSYSFAEGFVTPSTFDEFLTVENNNSVPVDVTITYFLAGGGTKVEPVVTVPANSRYTRSVNSDFPGAVQPASVQVTASGGAILVERPMYFSF